MARSAASRRGTRVTYRELSEEESDQGDESYSTGTRQSTRSSRRISSLKDPSTDEDVSSSATEDFVELQPTKRKAPARPIARRTRAKTERKPAIRRPRESIGRPLKRRNKARSSAHQSLQIETDGISPPWETLPYEVLQDIFDFALASYPDDEPKATSWLLGASRTCRAYTEPALSALYREPRLLKGTKIESFFNHMLTTTESQVINYHNKVRRLSLDTRFLGNSFDLTALIRQLPRLTYLNLWSSKDTILRGNASTVNERYWQPPPNLLETLAELNVPLASWHWNLKMMPISANIPIQDRWDAMRSVQSQRPLNRVKSLTLTNFDYSTREGDQFLDTTIRTLDMVHSTQALAYLPDNDPDVELGEALTARDPCSDAIKANPNLVSLRFDHCNIAQGPWLLRLMPLRSLDIDCASYLTSWHLERYLTSYGHRLQRLCLDHNPILNLDFLAVLKVSCPALQELSMDLVVSNPHKYNDIMLPKYDKMLNEGYIPSWPTSLQRLQLLHLKLNSEAAVVLFESIIGANQELRDLRQLIISASIDLDWRERTTFRDKWTTELQTTFLRTSEPPSAYLVSNRAFRRWRGKQVNNSIPAPQSKAETVESDDIRQLRPRGLSKDDLALSLRSRVMASLGNDSKGGLCEVVDIRIDNSRPREAEFRESDFLDSEQSGDEDYDYE